MASLLLVAALLVPGEAFQEDAQLPSAESVLTRVRAARGEPERAPANTTMTGRWTLTGVEGEGTFEDVLAGGKMYSKGEFPGWGLFEQGTDGEVFWDANPFSGVTIKQGEDADSARRMLGFLHTTNWKELYAQAECTGVEALGERPHYRLVLTSRTGAEDVWLVDTETHLPGRVDIVVKSSMGTETPMQIRMLEWQAVDGIQYPMQRETKGGPVTIAFTTDSVRHDADLAEDFFDLPEKVREAMESGKGERPPEEFEVKELEEQHVVTVRVQCPQKEMGRQMAVIFPEVMGYLNEAGVRPAGAPFSRYWSFDPAKVDFEVGMPVAKPVKGKDRIKATKLPAGRVVIGWHTGPYEKLHETYARMEAWVAEQELESLGGQWEVYWTDPGLEPDPAKWRTQIFFPVKKPG